MSTYWSGALIDTASLGVSVTIFADGLEAVGEVGNISLGVGASGVTGTGTLGTVSTSSSARVEVTSISGLGQISSVSGALVGVLVTSSVSASVVLTGVETYSGVAGSVNVTGAHCGAILGSVTSWGEIPDSVRIVWIEIT